MKKTVSFLLCMVLISVFSLQSFATSIGSQQSKYIKQGSVPNCAAYASAYFLWESGLVNYDILESKNQELVDNIYRDIKFKKEDFKGDRFPVPIITEGYSNPLKIKDYFEAHYMNKGYAYDVYVDNKSPLKKLEYVLKKVPAYGSEDPIEKLKASNTKDYVIVVIEKNRGLHYVLCTMDSNKLMVMDPHEAVFKEATADNFTSKYKHIGIYIKKTYLNCTEIGCFP